MPGGRPKGLKVSEETIEKRKLTRIRNNSDKKLSEKYKGMKLTPEWIANRTKSQRGLKRSPETKKRISEAHKGSKAYWWKGGVTPLNKIIRRSAEYKLWRESVFKRDDWTCVWCKKRGGVLNVDHIKRFSDFPELRFAIDNGRTLCVDCHKTTDTYGRPSLKIKQNG